MDLQAEIRERLRTTDNWGALIDQLEKELESTASPEDRPELHYQLGEACEELFLRKDKAMKNYQLAFKLNPKNTRALERARRIYREMGNLEMVVRLLELEVKTKPYPKRLIEIYQELGECLTVLRQVEKARDYVHKGAQLTTENVEIRELGEALSYDPANWKERAEQLNEEALTAPDESAAARFALRLARLYHIEAPLADDAVAAQVRANDLKITPVFAPDAPLTLQYERALRLVLTYQPESDEANFLLENLLFAEGRKDELVALQEERASRHQNPDERARLFRRFASLWAVRFKEIQISAHFYQRALDAFYAAGGEQFPGHLAAFGFLREIRSQSGEWQPLIDLAAKGVQASLGSEAELALATHAATILWKEMKNPEGAAPWFVRVQHLNPQSVALQEFASQLGHLLRDNGVATDAASVRSAAAAMEAVRAAEPEPAPVEMEVAPPAYHEPEPQRAVEPEPEPEPVAAAPILVAEPEPVAAPAPVEAAPAVAVDLGDDEEVSADEAPLLAAARQAASKGDEKGIDAWKKVVSQAPGAKYARRELRRLYQKLERWNPLVELLKDAADKESDPDRKVALLFELVGIYREKLKLDVMVVNTYTALLGIQPGNVQAIDALLVQYETMKRWPDLISLLQKKAALIDEPEEKVEHYLRVARLFLEKFSNQAEAIKAFEQVLSIDPLHQEAISYLKQMYEKRRDWERLVEINRKEIDTLPDEQRAARAIEVAKLASEKLKRPAVSIELWNQVLSYNAENLEALGELEKLYERERHFDQLAEVCEKQVVILDDAGKKSALLTKLGVLYGDKLNDGERAVVAWKGLLALEPENRRAQDALKKRYLETKSWDELEQFYADKAKWDEFIRVLERQVDVEQEQVVKVDLFFKIAQLWQDRLQKVDRAARSYEKVLSLDAQNARAARALVPIYEQAGDWKKLVQVLEIELDHTVATPDRLEIIRRIAGLAEEKLRDKSLAFGWYRKAFEADCLSDQARTDLERLAAETGMWSALVESYEQSVGPIDTPEDALPLLVTIARAYDAELGETDKAVEAYNKVLRMDPRSPVALDALESLYGRTEAWKSLLEIFQRKLELAIDAAEKDAVLELRYRIAGVWEDALGDLDQAVVAYRAILDEGEDLRALGALDRIFQQQGQWNDLAEVLPRELALVDINDVATQVNIKYRLGQIRETSLRDVPTAIACYREILELDASHDGAREALEKRLSDQEYQIEATHILEPIYEQLQDWPKLVQVHEIQLARELDRAARVGLLLRIGELHAQKIGNGEAAFDAYARCFTEDPTCGPARQELERLAQIQESYEALVKLYERALVGGGDESKMMTGEGGTTHFMLPDVELGRELLIRVGQLYEGQLDNPGKAVENYRKVLSLFPEDAGSIDALERLYTRTEQWTELLEIYRKKCELSGAAEERESLQFQMAYLQEEMLQNAEEAVATYKEILNSDPTNVKALKALDRLYQSAGAWQDLADVLQTQLGLAQENSEIIALNVRLATLREHQMHEVGAAVEIYRQVLELDPQNDAAISALEARIEDQEHQLVIATILEPLYKERQDWPRLVQVYEIMVIHALDPARKIELLHQIGELYELAAEEPGRSFATYGRALREDPANEETQKRLERLGREMGNWEELIGLYSEEVSKSTDPELQVLLLMKVARLFELEVGDLGKAAEHFRAVLRVSPQNLDAVNALENIFMQSSAWTDLVGVLLLKSDIVVEQEERKELCRKAAQLYEDTLEDQENAISVYRKILDIDENDVFAIDALERLYIRLERWDSLKDIYRKKAELAANVDEKKAMYYVLGQVYDQSLHDVDKAIETYQTILDMDAEDYQAIQALDRLYGQAQRWYDLLQILEREVELAQASGEVVALKFRVGQLWEKQLGDLTRAVEGYREILTIDPSHDPTLAALDAIVHGGAEPVLAAQVLEPIYTEACEWERLVDIYEVMFAHTEDPIRRVELLHAIAELHERRLENPSQAFVTYGRALREDSANDQTLMHLERLAGETGAWPDLARLYEAELEKMLDANRQLEMCTRVARVYEEELGRFDAAIDKFRRVLDADLENSHAILALDRLFTQTEQWPNLADILKREIRLAQDEKHIVELQFRLGQLFEQELKDTSNAIEAYREILNIDSGHSPTLSALELLFTEGVQQLEISQILEPLYRVAEQWSKLVMIYEVQLDKLDDPEERLSAIKRIAELHEEKLLDKPQAFAWWGRAISEAPESEEAFEQVERLARETDGWQELCTVYQHVVDSSQGKPDRAQQAGLKLGRALEEEVRDLGGAEQAFLKVLEIDPRDPAALHALDRIYAQSGMFEELAQILRRRIGITASGEELVELNYRLGGVLMGELGDQEGSVASYLAVLDVDPNYEPALSALENLYELAGDWPKLFDIYDREQEIASSDQRRAEILTKMARLGGERLGDPTRAVELFNRVLALRGEDEEALQALGELYERGEQWREFVDVLQRRVAIAHTSKEKIDLYRRLGQVWGEKLERERNALEAWMEILNIDPSSLEALREMARIYKATQAWEELVDTLHRLIELGITSGQMHDEELRALYAQLGELQGEILMRPQEAIDAWRKVLDIDHHDLQALGALEQLFTQEARWEECIEILEKKADALPDQTDKIEILMQVASIWEDKLTDRGSAASTYERILASDAGNLRASQSVEQIYRDSLEWDKLIELLIARVEHTETNTGRVELLQQVAKTYETELDSPERAFDALQIAFEYDYTNDITAKELERLAGATNKWNELLMNYNRVIQTISDAEVKTNLWVKMGDWYADKLGHPDYAIASFQQALSLDPANVPALESLEDLFRKSGRWPELVGVYARHVELARDPQEKTGLLLKIAQLWEEQLGDPNRAVDAYKAGLESDEYNLEALSALERIYKRQQRWDHLITILIKKAEALESGDPEPLIELRAEIGELYEERLNDQPRAIESFKQILSLEPRNLPALRALERLYYATGRMEEYVDTLEQELDVADDEERIAKYQQLATAWEDHFKKPDRSAECLEKVLVIDPQNEPVFKGLERIYRQERKWVELVDTLQKHVFAITSVSEIVGLYGQMGEVYEREVRDDARSIESYTKILDLIPDDNRALDALGRLYERTEDWDRAVDALTKLAEITDDAGDRCQLYYRIGRIYEDRLQDVASAEERYRTALRIDDGHLESAAALANIYRDNADWPQTVTMLEQQVKHLGDNLKKAELLHEAGKIYEANLGDEQKASERYAEALQHNPEHVGAAQPLVEIYFRDDKYAEVEPILDMLTRKSGKKDNKELNLLYWRLAKACDQLQKDDKALKYYKLAYELDATYLPTLTGMAAILYKKEDWDRAFKIYQTILVHHRESQSQDEIVDIFFRLGNIKQKVNEKKKALNMYEKALELNPAHKPTLLAVIDLQEKQGEWEQVISAKRQLLEATQDDDEARFELLEQIGDLYRDKLSNPQKAIQAYNDCLELKPTSPSMMQKLLEQYVASKQWKNAVEVALKRAEAEPNAAIKAKFYYFAGATFRDEIKGLDEAVEYFNLALDEQMKQVTGEIEPSQLKAFENIERILRGKKDYKALERSYRKMIRRFPAEGNLQLRGLLVHSLGEIYRTNLRDMKASTEAFALASNLEPENALRHQILAELYAVQGGPDNIAKAVKEHQFLLKREPYRVESYKALYKLYMDAKQYDKAWCLCSTLAFLKKADPTELQFFEQYRPKAIIRAKQRMSPDMWQRGLAHADEDPYIGAICATTCEATRALSAQPLKSFFGLKPKDKRDLATDQLTFSKNYNYVSQVLNIPPLDLYLGQDKPQVAGLMLANTAGPASFIVGADLLQGRSDKELVFLIARELTYVRSDHFLRRLLVPVSGVGALRTVFFAALRLVNPQFPVPGDASEVNKLMDHFRNPKIMQPAMIEQMVGYVGKFLQSKAQLDLNKWCAAVDMTSARAGLILANDLETAAKLVMSTPPMVGSPPPKEVVTDLVLYSVSEEYFALRQHLGFTIGS